MVRHSPRQRKGESNEFHNHQGWRGNLFKDWGPKDAQPIHFHPGWPLSADDWDMQMLFFLQHGYRVIAHDRRGHGRLQQVSDGHDMDHYTG
jgi:pimeloyl-ACP methyl ester carboxylesterase